MRLGIGPGSATLALLLVAAYSTPAQAGVQPWGEAAVQIHFCDQDASAHPTRVTMRQIVTTDTLADAGQIELLVQYSFAAAAGNTTIPAGETIRARVRVFKADGTRIDLGKLDATVGPAGLAAATKLVDLSLEEGDLVRWRFTFRGFPTLNALDTLVLIGATSRPGPVF